MIVVHIVLIALCSARLTRLITTDFITEPFRNHFLIEQNGEIIPKNKVGYLLHCDWCMGFWVTVIVGVLFYLYQDIMIYVVAVVAASYIQGILNSIEK